MRTILNTVVKVANDQWQTWVQHTGLLALTVGVDMRLGLDPILTTAVVFIMLGREIYDAKKHSDAGHPQSEWGLDFVMDWLTVILGVGIGFWIYGGG